MSRPTLSLCLALVALSCPIAPAAGQDRLIRRYGSVDGLRIGSVQKLLQDHHGFLWIGGVGGLRRWDGLEMRRWGADQIEGWVIAMTLCPDDRIYVVEEGGSLFEVAAAGLRAIATPVELRDAHTLSCDGDGALWVAGGTAVRRMDRDREWTAVTTPLLEGRRPAIVPGPVGPGAWLATEDGLWHLDRSKPPSQVTPLPEAVAVAEAAPGDTLVLTSSAGLFRLGRGDADLVMPAEGRGISMVVRGATVWVASDRSLAAVRDGEPPEVIRSELLPEGAGPLLVDAEGSLWLGTFSGLLELPEPETKFWNDRQGLPSAHTRFVARQGPRVWVSAWQGLGFVERRDGRWHAASRPEWPTRWTLHTGLDETLWIPSDIGVLEIAPDGSATRHGSPALAAWDIEDVPGGVWLATNQGLVLAATGRTDVVPVPNAPLLPGESVRQILRTRDGRILLAGNDRICGTRATVPSLDLPPDWSCDSVPDAVEITGLVEMPSGAIWASSSRLGVLRERGGRWERHPGSRQLSSVATYRLVPARDGSVWVLGFSTPIRVVERADDPAGWEVVEQLSAWQGIASEAQDLIEDEDGTLWLATSLGLARVPASARAERPEPPPVALVAVHIDGASVDAADTAKLRHRHNRVDLRWTALSFRDPGRIRFQLRLTPGGEWHDRDGPPSSGWIDLPRGRYTAEVRASLDGERWSENPAVFSWIVSAPWYLQSWALALGVLSCALIAYAVHRVRMAMVLRLERQRARIAMDLHDEMGSALGSIGILSGVLRDHQLAPVESARIADKIGETAGELGTTLSDIVWTLNSGTRSVEELAGRLAEHGSRLFASDSVRFDVEPGDASGNAHLDFVVFRSVLLIGVEAMHNAARHAQARRVVLAFQRAEASTWSMTISDDGRGLDGGAPARGGLGMSGMRSRAGEIGAEVEWRAPPSGGTCVTVRFRTRRGLA